MTWLHSEKGRLEAVATRCLVLPPGEDLEHRSAPRTSSWTLPSSSRRNGSCRRWRATRRDKLRSSAASPNSLASTAQLTYLTALLAGHDAEPDQQVALAGPVAQEGHPVTAVHVAAQGQHWKWWRFNGWSGGRTESDQRLIRGNRASCARRCRRSLRSPQPSSCRSGHRAVLDMRYVGDSYRRGLR